MPELVQHVVVSMAALGAAGVVVRRLLAIRTGKGQTPSCPSCASGHACATSLPVPRAGGVQTAREGRR